MEKELKILPRVISLNGAGAPIVDRFNEALKPLNLDRDKFYPAEEASACTPSKLVNGLTELDVKWDFPDSGAVVFKPSNIILSAYSGHPGLRAACFVSHARLWELAAGRDEVVWVMEDDVEFIYYRTVDYMSKELEAVHRVAGEMVEEGYYAVGMNDPRGATRRAGQYHRAVRDTAHKFSGRIMDAPWVDSSDVPQGLAGGSSYLVSPDGARAFLKFAREYGAWPNDCLICHQNFPGKLGQTKLYYTRVSGRPSTLK
jgi:hypothetical protein